MQTFWDEHQYLLQKCSLLDSLTSIIQQNPPCFKTSVNWGLSSLPQAWTFSTALFWDLGLKSTFLYWLFAPGWGGSGFYMIIYISWLTLLPGANPIWLLCPIALSWIWQIIKLVTDSQRPSLTNSHTQRLSRMPLSLAGFHGKCLSWMRWLSQECLFGEVGLQWDMAFTKGIQREASPIDKRCLRLTRGLSQGGFDKRLLPRWVCGEASQRIEDWQKPLKGVIDDGEL